MRDVGQMGESSFENWCAAVGITANKSNIDKYGWDYYVEFPTSYDENIFHDEQLPAIDCKIQVKSTDGNERKVQVKLSSLDRLVKAQMPTFYCFIEFNNKACAQTVYLVHVGKDLIAKTLNRIRKNDVNGRKKLNKLTMAIRFSDADKLLTTDGESLKSLILKYVPDGMVKYGRWKNKILETIGYESGSRSLNVSFKEEMIPKFVDMSIGLGGTVKVEDFQVFESRFNIVSNEPLVDEKHGGEISFGDIPPASSVSVCFRTEEFSPGVIFDAEVYPSGLNNVFPDEFKKVRIGARFFDIFIQASPLVANIKFKNLPDVNAPLEELHKYYELMKTLNNSTSDLYFEIMSKENSHLIKQKVQISLPDLGFDKRFETVEILLQVVRQYRMSSSTVLNNHEMFNKATIIKAFSRLIFKKNCTVKIEVFSEKEEINIDQKFGGTVYTTLELGQHIFGYMFAYIGAVSKLQDSEYMLKSNQLVCRKFLMAPKSLHDDALKNYVEECEAKLVKEGIQEENTFQLLRM